MQVCRWCFVPTDFAVLEQLGSVGHLTLFARMARTTTPKRGQNSSDVP